MKPATLLSTYLHLKDDGSATLVEVTPELWPELTSRKRPELEAGRMVMQFDFDDDWTSWEMHPAGDEIGILLSGVVEVVMELDDSMETKWLSRPGELVLIPKGVWHTARVRKPASMVFITPGAGTQHKDA